MARIYLVEHVTLGLRYALKLLDLRLSLNPTVVTRFYNEAIALAKLDHPNLVRVHHVDRVPETGAVYMVLDYLEGETVGHHLAMRGALAPAEVMRLFGGPASALAKAHQLGAIHRDIKPDNLFMTSAKVLLLDFGVARLSEEMAQSPGTQLGTIVGTPTYMAAEQLAGQRVTYAADVYALAVCLYEALSGCLPLQLPHESRAHYIDLPHQELYERHGSAPIELRHRVPGISEALARAVMRGLSPNPAERGESVAAYMFGVAGAAGEAAVEALRRVAPDLVPRSEAPTLSSGHKPLVVASASRAESRYRIVDKLGAGGMAEVFTAEQHGDSGFKRLVVLKRVLPGLSDDPQFNSMFLSEAKLASWLNHPNIVTVSDFSRDEEGRAFLVMEYVHGQDLGRVMELGSLPPSLIIYLLSEVCRGLGHAHNAIDPTTGTPIGMLHRDVKPHNVLLGYEGMVVVADFGLAKVLSHSGRALSQTVKGTPRYMSPEQARGLALDRSTDLWPVGVMLYEMLTGRPLFDGLPTEVMGQVAFKDIVRPSEVAVPSGVRSPSAVARRIPPDLEAVAMKLLSRDRAARYQTAEAVIEALVACKNAPRDGRGELVRFLAEHFAESTARLRSSTPGHGSLHPTTTLEGAASQPLHAVRPERRMPLLVLLGLAMMIIAAGSAFVVVRHKRPNREATIETSAASTSETHERVALAILDAGVAANAATARAPVVDATMPPSDAPVLAAGSGSSRGSAAAGSAIASRSEGSHPSPRPPPVAAPPHVMGELFVSATTSWAKLTVDGQPAQQTPQRFTLAVGKHKLRMQNPDSGQDKTIMITITPNETTTITADW